MTAALGHDVAVLSLQPIAARVTNAEEGERRAREEAEARASELDAALAAAPPLPRPERPRPSSDLPWGALVWTVPLSYVLTAAIFRPPTHGPQGQYFGYWALIAVAVTALYLVAWSMNASAKERAYTEAVRWADARERERERLIARLSPSSAPPGGPCPAADLPRGRAERRACVTGSCDLRGQPTTDRVCPGCRARTQLRASDQSADLADR